MSIVICLNSETMQNLITIVFKSLPFLGISLAISFLATSDPLFLEYLAPLLIAYSSIFTILHLFIGFNFGLFADYQPELILFDVLVLCIFVLLSSIAFWVYLSV